MKNKVYLWFGLVLCILSLPLLMHRLVITGNFIGSYFFDSLISIIGLTIFLMGLLIAISGDALQEYLRRKEQESPSPSLQGQEQTMKERLYFGARRLLGKFLVKKKITPRNEENTNYQENIDDELIKRIEEKKREENVRRHNLEEHIKGIDPGIKVSPDSLNKILSGRYFTPGAVYEKENLGEDLDLEDLVAVHLTNTLPEEGKIKPTEFYVPKSGRRTIHFSLNHPVKSHMYGQWDDRKYVILIPLSKLKDRILNFNPVDTFVYGELVLPEGSVVIARKDALEELRKKGVASQSKNLEQNEEDVLLKKIGNAKVILSYARKPEEFRRDIYQKIVSMGYIPMVGGMREWGKGDWEVRHLHPLCEKENLRIGAHMGHWTEELESIYSPDSSRRDNPIKLAREFVRKYSEVAGKEPTPEAPSKEIIKEVYRFLYENKNKK